jgi:hypothetical protein
MQLGLHTKYNVGSSVSPETNKNTIGIVSSGPRLILEIWRFGHSDLFHCTIIWHLVVSIDWNVK